MALVYENESNPLIHIGSQVYLLLVSGVRKGYLFNTPHLTFLETADHLTLSVECW